MLNWWRKFQDLWRARLVRASLATVWMVELSSGFWLLTRFLSHETYQGEGHVRKCLTDFSWNVRLDWGKNRVVGDLPHWLHTDIDHTVILAWNVSDRWIHFKRRKIFISHYFELLWFCCNLLVLLHFRCISNYLNSGVFIVFPLNIFHRSSTRCNVFVLGDEWNISHEM
jgi:hypothetical protein